MNSFLLEMKQAKPENNQKKVRKTC